jgi:ribosome-binding protein aMBF1 (putative translation factor)
VPLDERLIIMKEMRDCTQDILNRASGMAFNHIRLSEGLSIDELASLLEISTIKLKLIEKGDILPTPSLIEKLTQLFKLNEKHDSEGNITLTYHEIFFVSIKTTMLADIQKLESLH